MDPASIGIALSVASSAMSKITTFYNHGKDLSAMTGEIQKWMGACSDVDNIEKQAKNPSLFRKMVSGKGIEGIAFEALTARKKLEEDRQTLKVMIQMRYGSQAWSELIAIEGKVRKKLQEEKYARQRFKEKVISVVAISTVVSAGVFILCYFIYILLLLDRGELG
mgnify:CR=1 FL=1|tara:strand:- start:19 stop:513 length:495 start_codon:yes stop_codon:yes gene_type:complete